MRRFDVEFEFDHEIVTTDVYWNTLKSLRVLKKGKSIAATKNDRVDGESSPLLIGHS